MRKFTDFGVDQLVSRNATSVTPGQLMRKPLVLSMTPRQLFAVVLAVIFLSETVVMLVLPHLQPNEPTPVVVALTDSILLTAFLIPLLYFLVFGPLRTYFDAWDEVRRQQHISEQRFLDVAANAREWIWEVDAHGRYTYASPAVRDILGFEVEDVLGKHFFDMFHPEERETVKADAARAFAAKQPFRGFVNRNLHRDGHTVWLATSGVAILDDGGELIGYRGLDLDITELKEMEQRLKEAAITDELTGLLNRRGFLNLAEHQLTVAQRNGRRSVLVFVDVDDLKPINDQFGHAVGDQALVDLAQIFKRLFRRSDVVGRLGGDEFALLLLVAAEGDVENRVLRSLHEEIFRFNRRGQRPYTLAVSTGILRCEAQGGDSIETMLRTADLSMYEQKKQKKRPSNTNLD